MRRFAAVLFLITLASEVAQGYYHFLRYVSRDGHQVPLAQKFNLNALPNKTVSYFLSDQPPDKMAEGDSLLSLTSQIKLAAKQWNDIETSELRLQYGGVVSTPADTQTVPGIDIVFGDVPPGLIALGGPTITADKIEIAEGGTFVPIPRSQVILPRDMSNLPSWSEFTFGTIVHELGHALGLQHTLTSSVMSTFASGRAVTKGRVLGVDDIAGLSLLYPTNSFRLNLGAISGRVTSGGNGVALASVVAISARGAAVSVLTHPDGTYRIDGIPPGQYFIYVHPLPPTQTGEASPANIVLPIDNDKQALQPSAAFDLEFYPGVRDSTQASAIPVTAGANVDGIDFNVSVRRTAQSLFNVITYSFPDQQAVRPAYVNVNAPRNFFVATGNGILTATNQPVSGLRVGVLGGSTLITDIQPYYSSRYLQFALGYTEQTGEGTRHLVFSTPTETYVQPAALTLTTKQPPRISAVALDALGSASITGTNLGADTKIFFDGSPAVIRSFDDTEGRLTVGVPPSGTGHRATIVAVNRDGQSSLFVQAANPPAQALTGVNSFGATVAPASLAAGAESVIEINAPGANFANGQVTLGFGTSDVTVKRLWVLSATKLLAQVQVSSAAPSTAYNLTVTNGLQSVSLPSAFSTIGASLSIQSARPQVLVLPNKVNPVTGIAGAVPGDSILAQVAGTAASAFTATINDRAATVSVLAPGVVFIRIPAELAPGPGVLRLDAEGQAAVPIAIEIERPVLLIDAISATSVHPGDSIKLTIPGLRTLATPFAKLRVTASVAGVDHLVQVSPETNNVSFTLLPSVPTGDAQVIVTINGRPSPAVHLTVEP